MCDYSLHHVATTPAKVGDKLTSTLFRSSVTRGFCAVGAPEVAVCILPGAELAFESDVKIDRVFAFLPKKTVKAHVARFRQVNMDKPYEHHDALEFPDGRIVLVTQLTPGQKVTVLQLPAVPRGETKKPETTPIADVAPLAPQPETPRTSHRAF